MEVTKMAEYDNTNSFALFKQVDKQGNDARPDYTGNITLEGGKEMRMAAWIKTSQSGLKFLSGRISEPQVQTVPDNAVTEGEDVPF